MKISYIGNFLPEFSTENDVRKAFEILGHDVIKIQENTTPLEMLRSSALNSDLLLITGTWDSIPLPDMLDLFHDLSEKGIASATIHLDTFWGKSRGGRKWWRESMFHTSYIFTADGDWKKEWELLGKNHHWLMPAVRHDAVNIGIVRPEYQCDVAFVGSNGIGYHEDVWGYRKELVDRLRMMCKKNGWKFKNPGGDDPKVDRGQAMNDFYASAALTVGDSLCLKKEQSKYFSDRQMEQWGRGSFSIMPKINILDDLFNGNQPFYNWGDFNDLEKKIEYYLNNPDLRKELTNKNHELVKKEHTYVNRAQEVLGIIFPEG